MKKMSFAKKKVYSLVLPASFALLISFATILADTVISGRFVGADAVSAVNLVSPVISVVTFVLGIVSTGCMYMYCDAIGDFNKERADRIYGEGLVLSVAISVVLYFFMTYALPGYIDFMNVSDSIRNLTLDYTKYGKWCIILLPIQSYLECLLYSDGDAHLVSAGSIGLIAGNIVLSYIFTAKYGIVGTGMGSVSGALICTLIILLHFFKKSNNLHFVFYMSLKDIKEMWDIAKIDSCFYLALGLLDFALTKFVIMRFGDFMIPALAVGISIFGFTIVFDGIGVAFGPLAEVYVAEKNYSCEKKLISGLVPLAVIEGLVMTALLFVGARGIALFFGIEDPALLKITEETIKIMSLCMPFYGVGLLIASQGLIVRHLNEASVFILLLTFAAPTAFSIVCGLAFGFVQMALAYLIAPIVCFAIGALYILKKYGRDMFPWLVPEDDCPIYDESIMVSPESVVSARDNIEAFLIDNNIQKEMIMGVMAIAEECGMLIYEKNKGKNICAEYTVRAENDKVVIYIRDNGVIFDISDENLDVTSLTSYVVSVLMKNINIKKYLVSVGFNRMMIELNTNSQKGN